MEIPAALGVQLAFFCHLLEALTDSNNFAWSCNHIPCGEKVSSIRVFLKALPGISDRADGKNNPYE